MKILLRFASNKNFASAVVRRFTRSEFSHIDYIFADGRAYSSLPRAGVGFNTDANDREEYFEIEVKDKKKIEDFLLYYHGAKYDWSAIFGFTFRSEYNDTAAWFCSELITAAIEQDTVLFNEPNKYRITPRDMYINPLLKRVSNI